MSQPLLSNIAVLGGRGGGGVLAAAVVYKYCRVMNSEVVVVSGRKWRCISRVQRRKSSHKRVFFIELCPSSVTLIDLLPTQAAAPPGQQA